MRVLNGFDYIYLIASVFGTYVIYRFMGVFFHNSEVDKRREIISYVSYFLVVGFEYLFFNIPIVTMILNLVFLFIISLNYRSTTRKRIISIFMIYIILVIIELVVVLISGYLDFDLFTQNTVDNSIIGHITIKLATFISVLLMENYKDIKKGFSVPLIYQVAIFLIPLGSLYLIILLVSQKYNIDLNLIILGIAILFSMNISIFYLYNRLNRRFEDKLEALYIEGQNKYYKNQIEIMKENENNIKVLNQELKDQLKQLKMYISEDKNIEAIDYIEKLMEDTPNESEISSSGNVDIDSILNYKLKHAKSQGIRVSLKNHIPVDIKIPSIDIITVISHLIDNAVNETIKREDKREINIKMRLNKGVLFISVDHSFKENICNINEKKASFKSGKDSYKAEFNNIEKILKKYNGMMVINNTDRKCNIDVLMYSI